MAVTSQCGIGGGTGRVSPGSNPASRIHPFSSSSENTQPFAVVSAMLTAKSAENFGAVCVRSVIMSRTRRRPPGLSARFARFRMSTICAGLSWCSAPKIVTAEMVSTMARDAIVFAMANPTPEIMPEEAKKGGARVVATGRSDYPNQINNVLVFPGLFRGALMVEAKQIVEEMKLAAARAIASLCADAELNEDYIIPGAFDKRVALTVADQVAQVAESLGLARNPGNRKF